MLDKEYEFYQAKKAELLTAHFGKWVVIAGQEVSTIVDSKEDAYAFGFTHFGLGNFFMQHLISDEQLMVVFHSRVYVEA